MENVERKLSESENNCVFVTRTAGGFRAEFLDENEPYKATAEAVGLGVEQALRILDQKIGEGK